MPLTRRARWILIAVLCLVGALIAAAALDWLGWVQGWVGAMFKAASGGALGYAVSRYAVGLDLSELEHEKRPLAALSQALLIGLFAVAVAFGT